MLAKTQDIEFILEILNREPEDDVFDDDDW